MRKSVVAAAIVGGALMMLTSACGSSVYDDSNHRGPVPTVATPPPSGSLPSPEHQTNKEQAAKLARDRYGGTVTTITSRSSRGHSELWVVDLADSGQGDIAVLVEKDTGLIQGVLPADARPSVLPSPAAATPTATVTP